MAQPHDTVITADKREDFLGRANELVPQCWPEFMRHDPLAGKYWLQLYERFATYQFALLDNKTEEFMAVGNCLPLVWDKPALDLPAEGWDWALVQGVADAEQGRAPTTLSAIQIMVAPGYRNRGLSARMVQLMKAIGKAHGLTSMIAPVRPTLKHRYPLATMEQYLRWRNNDRLPFDPWLRVHVKSGAHIIKVCPQSMRITGTVREFEQWTGMRFPESGMFVVPGALIPVEIDREADRGTYIEPNVWVHYPGLAEAVPVNEGQVG
jgi:GNAT superfamily N-acetyltransferase